MTTTTPIRITADNVDSLERLDCVPEDRALLDCIQGVEDDWKLSHTRWLLTREDGSRLRSRYSNDLVEYPAGGLEATYMTERALAAWSGRAFKGQIVTCAGIVVDPPATVQDWATVPAVG